MMLLLARCNAPKPTHNPTATESPVALKAPSSLMYADIDPFIHVDDLTKNELIQLFAKMYQADQQYRDSLNNGRKENETFFLQKMRANDEANLKVLDNIIQKHGWPYKSVFGEEAADTAWLIIWHHRGKRSVLCRHFDLMEKAVNEGEMSASAFQQIKDQVELLSPDQIDY
ncbi:hypothetical protein J2Y45_000104 [Dyadobacter sp. BE34]|uniref:Uncharacterized protein n=1 Tax=Dyadobacter fermentans TaxID=94254 RepID=A0ABU1R7H3_9BACT|nr:MULTISPECIES: hypothetical protein [Dyadobacter]MDR6809351.1 hypothetical protein [Dyadobacter fermentans]MDR7047055.1 hypothetical protein [Dyadobacter sp. BE242]MDR7194978.1 hypothetical protein [Dyadobacter sp. BE34]MDR7214477.1 hypothetical protein [Dyadobacter sp. BE31]MDR7266900.1 hypothetical protein [Dyadobacter sp. BE32]